MRGTTFAVALIVSLVLISVAHGGAYSPRIMVADLSIDSTGPFESAVDIPLTLIFTAANPESFDMPNVTISITVPDVVSFIEAISEQGSCQYNAGTVECTLGTLAAGDDAAVEITVIPTQAGLIQFTGTAAGGFSDPNQTNNTSTSTVIIRENLVVTPGAGTIGTLVTIRGTGFGEKKGKVTLTGGARPISLKVLSWNEGGSGEIVAAIGNAQAGDYGVSVYPKFPKGVEISEDSAITINSPSIMDYSESGFPGDLCSLSGSFLGTGKGKLYIQYDSTKGLKRKACKVLTWPSSSQSGTELGDVDFIVPKGIPAGAHQLLLVNKVGEDSVAFTVADDL